MQTSRLRSFSSNNSPSFGSFSTAVDLAAIAARVVDEFRDQQKPQSDSHRGDDDDGDFEFAFDCPSRGCSHPIATADEIFCNGQIRPLNPYGVGIRNGGESQPTQQPRRRRPALRKLMSEDRDPSSNSTSDEAEGELTGVPPESYCVWKPKQSNEEDDLQGLSLSSPSRSKIKSNSAGFSKRWKLRNILYARSSSEGGNDKLVFPAPVKKTDEEEGEEEKTTSSKEEERESEETNKKDMIGILKSVNGLSRHLRPF